MIISVFEAKYGGAHELWEQSLRAILKQSGIDLTVVPASLDLKTALKQWEKTNDIFTLAESGCITKDNRLLIPCASDFYKQYCLRENPNAMYGCCLLGEYIAIEYAPATHKLNTQLHESLHLFGVDECYNPETLEPIRECTSSCCVMRYGVDSTEVCSHVLAQLNRQQAY